MNLYPTKTNFTGGEVSPRLHSRIDTKAYANGAKYICDYFVQPQGGLVVRGGFMHVSAARDSDNPVKLIPFKFSEDESQSYMIEFGVNNGTGYARFYHNRAPLSSDDSFNPNTTLAHTGTGLDDVTVGGYFIGDEVSEYVITCIENTSTPGYSAFEIRRNGELNDGLFDQIFMGLDLGPYDIGRGLWFNTASTSGHTVGDTWTFTVGPSFEIETVFESQDIPNLRYAQDADVMVIVDGRHDPQQLTRLGPTHVDWEIKDYPAINPGWSLGNKLFYKYFFTAEHYTKYGQPATRSDMDSFFAESATVFLAGKGYHEKEAAGWNSGPIAWGNTSYNALPDYIQLYSGQVAGEEMKTKSWCVDGYVYAPEAGDYVFGLNCDDGGDVTVNGELVAFKYPYYGTTNAEAMDSATEFKQNGIVNLTRGTNSFKARLINWTNTYGIAVAWRKSESPALSNDGGTTGNRDIEITNHYWGNAVLEYEIKVQTDQSKFNVRRRRVLGDPNENYSTDWVTVATNQTVGTTEVFIDSPGGTGVKIRFASGGNVLPGDTWTFREGLEIIPEEAFEQKYESGSDPAYPRTICFYQGRAFFGGSSRDPQTLWGSAPDNIWEFTPGEDSLTLTLRSNTIDSINGLISKEDLIVLTAGGPYTVSSGDNPFLVENISVTKRSSRGAAFLAPCLAENEVLFVDKSKHEIREMSYDLQSDGLVTNDLTVLADHLFTDEIKEIVFQPACVGAQTTGRSQIDLLWAIVGTTLRAMTYNKQHDVYAWVRVECGGEVNSMAVIPNSEGAEIYVAVTRDGVRHIEYLSASAIADSEGNPDTSVVHGFDAEAETLPIETQFGRDADSIGMLKRIVNPTVIIGEETDYVELAHGEDPDDKETWSGDAVAIGESEQIDFLLTGFHRRASLRVTIPAGHTGSILGIHYGKVKVNPN